MNLREAIVTLQNVNLSKLHFNETVALSRVLAAARAFACDRCGGHGQIWNAYEQCYVTCEDCRDDREKARGS